MLLSLKFAEEVPSLTFCWRSYKDSLFFSTFRVDNYKFRKLFFEELYVGIIYMLCYEKENFIWLYF